MSLGRKNGFDVKTTPDRAAASQLLAGSTPSVRRGFCQPELYPLRIATDTINQTLVMPLQSISVPQPQSRNEKRLRELFLAPKDAFFLVRFPTPNKYSPICWARLKVALGKYHSTASFTNLRHEKKKKLMVFLKKHGVKPS